MIRASCTWGDGPDVMVSFSSEKYHNKKFILYENPNMEGWKHGYVENGSFDLTADEAENLAFDLLSAVRTCRDLEQQLKEDEKRWKDEQTKNN